MYPLKQVKKIIVHCSDSEFGDAETIDRWHREIGWAGCGYHYVITNGVRVCARPYNDADDGVVEAGRPEDVQGAHVRGHNEDSIGVCLIGKHHFTAHQLFLRLPDLLADLIRKHDLTVSDILGHHELDIKKTCPNISMVLLREQVAFYIESIK